MSSDHATRPAEPAVPVDGGVRWLSDLIRLEIALWGRVDARLRIEHDLPLVYFETLWFLAHSAGGLRVGELSSLLRITQGGTSKLAERIAGAGLIRRKPDPDDGRASLLFLTAKGKRVERTAEVTYEAELAAALSILEPRDRQAMHRLVTRVLEALPDEDGSSS